LSCLNEDASILNFDFDLKFRDERCALVCMLRLGACGKLVLKEFVYTSRVQLKREEFGHSAQLGNSLTGVCSNFMLEGERKATCAELSLDPDLLTVRVSFFNCV
jgi:hypothetical protein